MQDADIDATESKKLKDLGYDTKQAIPVTDPTWALGTNCMSDLKYSFRVPLCLLWGQTHLPSRLILLHLGVEGSLKATMMNVTHMLLDMFRLYSYIL